MEDKTKSESKTTSNKSNQSESSKEPKKSGSGCLRNCLVSLTVFLLILVGAGVLGWRFLQNKLADNDLPVSPTVTIENGTAEKQSGSGWQALTSGTTLTPNDTIKTLAQSEATIAFPTGSELRLDENTQVTISQADTAQTSIFQALGRTWSRVENILGKSQYEVETPTTVATVRGTAFSTAIIGEDTEVNSDENTVEVAAIEKIAGKRTVLDKLLLEAGSGTRVRKTDLSELKAGRKKLLKEAIRSDIRESGWFTKNRERDRQLLERLRRRGANPGEILSLLRTSKDDVVKLKNLLDRAKSGQLTLNQKQLDELEPLLTKLKDRDDPNTFSQTAAAALKIVDPVDFADTSHWTATIKKLLPLLKQFGLLKSLQQAIESSK